MNDLVCPHCRGNVQHGATVCRGCQAEIDYGTPGAAFLILAALSAFLGFKVYFALPNSLSFLAWGVGIGLFIAGRAALIRMFEKRVVFNRVYRTR